MSRFISGSVISADYKIGGKQQGSLVLQTPHFMVGKHLRVLVFRMGRVNSVNYMTDIIRHTEKRRDIASFLLKKCVMYQIR